MTRGQFISFEGGEGAGKSTQVGRLVARLQTVLGERKVVRTREPGGSRGAEVIRNLVVATDAEPWSAMTETLPQRLGKAFRKRREALGFSQESYADEIGMHRTYYSAIERGEKNLQLDTLQKVCEGLQTSIWEVFRDAETGR